MADPRIESIASAGLEVKSQDVSCIYSDELCADGTTSQVIKSSTFYFPEPGIEVPTDLGVVIKGSQSVANDLEVNVYYEKVKASREKIDSLITFYAIAAEVTPTEIDDDDQDQSADIDPSKQAAGEA